jgi:hypothetical protein
MFVIGDGVGFRQRVAVFVDRKLFALAVLAVARVE